jgi:RimJ/RimL family protein N-acetyltransferase
MSDPDEPSLPFTHRPTGGSEILVRAVTPEDRFLIESGFDELSAQSRFFRFMNAHPNLTEAELNRFAASSDADHCAIGAVETDGGHPVAIARYIRLPGAADTAEVAVTVIDTYQGHGIGRLLLRALAHEATVQGIDAFVAYMHPDNRAMIGLLSSLGGTRVGREPGEIEMRVPLNKGGTSNAA